MAITYRKTNNILASIYYFITAQLTADGLTWNLIYGFKKTYSTTLPVIAIRAVIKELVFAEIGSTSTTKDYSIYIDIFASDDDEKNNIKDWLTETIIDGCAYNTYVIGNDGVPVATATSKNIIITSLSEEAINLNTDKSQLDIHDRYRFRLNLTVTTGEVS